MVGDDGGMIQVYSFTEAGGHEKNEDAFLIQPHPAQPNVWLCSLADGMGGRSGGARAAEIACRSALEHASTISPAQLLDPTTWPDILGQADRAVAADPVAGFSTLIALAIADDTLAGGSCGDSAVFVVHGDGEEEELTVGQRKNPPVGSGEAMFAMMASVLVRPWKILVLSDGVWKYGGWDRIAAIAREYSGQALVDALQTPARLPRSGRFQDDFTVVLIERG
jgi:hypothetical protein